MTASVAALTECRALHERLSHAAEVLGAALINTDTLTARYACVAIIEAADAVETALLAVDHAAKALAAGAIIDVDLPAPSGR